MHDPEAVDPPQYLYAGMAAPSSLQPEVLDQPARRDDRMLSQEETPASVHRLHLS